MDWCWYHRNWILSLAMQLQKNTDTISKDAFTFPLSIINCNKSHMWVRDLLCSALREQNTRTPVTVEKSLTREICTPSLLYTLNAQATSTNHSQSNQSTASHHIFACVSRSIVSHATNPNSLSVLRTQCARWEQNVPSHRMTLNLIHSVFWNQLFGYYVTCVIVYGLARLSKLTSIIAIYRRVYSDYYQYTQPLRLH